MQHFILGFVLCICCACSNLVSKKDILCFTIKIVFIPYHAEKLSFWIDNIHCYATEKAQTGQTEKKGGLNPPIIMVCTGDDTDDGHVSQ